MIVTHRIELDPNDRQETALRQQAGYARYAWNWGLAESKRALDAEEELATSGFRLRRVFNAAKPEEARWSKGLSQNAAKYALVALVETWGRFWTSTSG